MTEAQIKWASEHSWFVHREGETIVVDDHTYDSKTQTANHAHMSWIGTFGELRAWAGY